MPVEIRPAVLSDVGEIARLHQLVLGYTLNARLGHAHLCRLYRGLLRSPYGLVFCASHQSQLVGFVGGTQDAKRLQADLMRTPGTRILVSLALGLVWRPWLLGKLIVQVQINRPVMYQQKEVRASLLTLGVHPDFQRQGIGQQVVQALMAEFRHRGVEHFHLNTKVHNPQAGEFYRGLGGQLVRSWNGNDIYLFSLKPGTLVPTKTGQADARG